MSINISIQNLLLHRDLPPDRVFHTAVFCVDLNYAAHQTGERGLDRIFPERRASSKELPSEGQLQHGFHGTQDDVGKQVITIWVHAPFQFSSVYKSHLSTGHLQSQRKRWIMAEKHAQCQEHVENQPRTSARFPQCSHHCQRHCRFMGVFQTVLFVLWKILCWTRADTRGKGTTRRQHWQYRERKGTRERNNTSKQSSQQHGRDQGLRFVEPDKKRFPGSGTEKLSQLLHLSSLAGGEQGERCFLQHEQWLLNTPWLRRILFITARIVPLPGADVELWLFCH